MGGGRGGGERGVRVQMGHTLGSYEEGVAGLAHGAQGFTHLFNAMTGLHHRKPGMVGAALALQLPPQRAVARGYDKGQPMPSSQEQESWGTQMGKFLEQGDGLDDCVHGRELRLIALCGATGLL